LYQSLTAYQYQKTSPIRTLQPCFYCFVTFIDAINIIFTWLIVQHGPLTNGTMTNNSVVGKSKNTRQFANLNDGILGVKNNPDDKHIMEFTVRVQSSISSSL
jgi:hypothetical protein